MPKDPSEEEALARVRALGYLVKKPGPYTKFSLVVHEETLMEFKEAANQLGYEIAVAGTEAFDLWVKSKKRELEATQKK